MSLEQPDGLSRQPQTPDSPLPTPSYTSNRSFSRNPRGSERAFASIEARLPKVRQLTIEDLKTHHRYTPIPGQSGVVKEPVIIKEIKDDIVTFSEQNNQGYQFKWPTSRFLNSSTKG